MKTLITLLSAAAFVAFLALPVNGEIAGSLAFASSLLLILNADYGRQLNPLVRTPANAGSRESLRLAA